MARYVDGYVLPVPKRKLDSFRSRAHRDRVNQKVMQDPRLKDMSPETMPFDTKRMIWGGFKTMVAL